MIDTIQSISRSINIAQLVESLRYDIVSRTLAQDLMLPENALAEEYGISRGTVRTALQVLENEGLVGTKPNGRKFVVGISDKDVSDYYDIRCMLECEAGRIILAMDYIDYSKLSQVVTLFHVIPGEQEETLHTKRVKANSQFHRVLIEMAQNRALLQSWNSIAPVLTALANINSIALTPATHEHDYVVEHTKILEYIMKRDHKLIDFLIRHVKIEARNATYKGIKKIGGK